MTNTLQDFQKHRDDLMMRAGMTALAKEAALIQAKDQCEATLNAIYLALIQLLPELNYLKDVNLIRTKPEDDIRKGGMAITLTVSGGISFVYFYTNKTLSGLPGVSRKTTVPSEFKHAIYREANLNLSSYRAHMEEKHVPPTDSMEEVVTKYVLGFLGVYLEYSLKEAKLV